jgi:hypothetical protein
MRAWEKNVETDLKNVVCQDVEWIYLANDRGCCEHGNGPSRLLKGGK